MLGPAQRALTQNGWEGTLATNHLGVFALTGLVLDRLLQTQGSRVVTVSSLTHGFAKLDLDDLQGEHRKYRRNDAYGRSKLANLMFTYELQRRLTAAGAQTLSLAAPGQSRTEFTRDLKGHWR